MVEFCTWEINEDGKDDRDLICPNCSEPYRASASGVKPVRRCYKNRRSFNPPPPIIVDGQEVDPREFLVGNAGPGTELAGLLLELGLTQSPGCQCERRKRLMNYWGVDGCRLPENRETIIGWLKEEAKKASWTDSIEAWARAATMGIFSIESLLDEAIHRAERSTSCN